MYELDGKVQRTLTIAHKTQINENSDKNVKRNQLLLINRGTYHNFQTRHMRTAMTASVGLNVVNVAV